MIDPTKIDVVAFSDLLPRRQPQFWALLRAILNEHRVPVQFLRGTRDIWARDYSPIQVSSDRFVQFTYTPDYLADAPELRTRARELSIPPRLTMGRRYSSSQLVLDGGNIACDERGHVVLTEKVLADNPTQPRSRLLARLRRLLRTNTVSLIPREPWDVFGHADGILWFVGPNRVVVNDYRKHDAGYRRSLLDALTAAGIEYEEVPYAPRRSSRHPHSAFGTYTNILHAGKVVLVPTYGETQDKTVLTQIRRLTAGKVAVEGIDCRGLSLDGGCVNCVSWPVQLAAQGDA
jgi:agmatine deiminase